MYTREGENEATPVRSNLQVVAMNCYKINSIRRGFSSFLLYNVLEGVTSLKGRIRRDC